MNEAKAAILRFLSSAILLYSQVSDKSPQCCLEHVSIQEPEASGRLAYYNYQTNLKAFWNFALVQKMIEAKLFSYRCFKGSK